jgi:oligoendopeptidase F
MEYMSLCYGENTEDLVKIKLADSLCTYVEQAAFAAFEQQMYALTGDDLSVEGLYGLYEEVAQAYGFESVGYDKREFVTITHYYTNPMYIISYVVSNDAAMQLYQMELEEPGAGLSRFEENLDTQVSYFLEFLDSAGLESPFAEGRIQQVRSFFRSALG